MQDLYKILLTVLISLSGAGVYAQTSAPESPYKFDFGVELGMSGYLGDANTSSLFKHPGLAGEASFRYIANTRWALRGVLGVVSLSGNTADMEDYLPGGAQYSFKSTVYDLGARVEFNFLPYGIGETYKRLHRWTPYLTVGVGACMASSGGDTSVMPTLPIGAGIKFKLRPRLNLGVEFTMTKAFGDKVDGSDMHDLHGIEMKFYKNTDWYSRITIGISFEFGERCETCHYVD